MILASCTKAECKIGSDCQAKTCYSSSCESKKCVYSLQSNCCGNGIKDNIEDGKPGNQCTCPQDYGKCEGKGKVKFGIRTEDAAYVHNYCNANSKCVLGIERKDIVPQNFLDTIDIGFFKASSIEKYNKPFDVNQDSFEFKVSLDDASKDLVLPVKLTKIRLLYSSDYSRTEQLIAEKDLDVSLSNIGENAIIYTPLTLNYKPQELEENGAVRYELSYAYTKKVVSGRTAGGGELYAAETVRATFTATTKSIFVVRSG